MFPNCEQITTFMWLNSHRIDNCCLTWQSQNMVVDTKRGEVAKKNCKEKRNFNEESICNCAQGKDG